MIRICLKFHKNITKVRLFATKANKEMKFLNVAEKNDAAKTIAGLLSNGAARRREGLSVYNKIYEFETPVRGNNSKMVMTSVSGHLLGIEFTQSYKNWKNCEPLQLFDATIRRSCIENFLPIKKTLEREIKSCQGLIIWTDCDREGESIGFEIIEVCKAVKPNIAVYRAKFSEITTTAVRRALANLAQPDKHLDDAVTVRSELDLRTGAALTRLQTMRLQRLFPEKIASKLISYGSCQIPTLGFVVERYKEVEAFVSEPFWKIKVTHTIDDLTVDFNWARNRLFDKESCEDYLMLCLADPKAKVENVTVKPKNKWRPTAMDTVEMEKLGSRKLKLSAKETMTIAEKLYTQGIISYPRTETNMFSKEIDLKHLVEQQQPHSVWGAFASRVMEWGPNPRNGNKSDQAHPPIHPTKMVTNLGGNEGRVYELIVRHFLACVSKDATGSETIVNIDIAGEKFNATGLCIFERNYLDVYIYEKWNAKLIHRYEIGQIFDPTEIAMQEGATTAPPLLTEADLISLMEKHGIGTDATHADHINTIKERGYIGEADRGCLVPGVIGMGLYESYDAMQLVLAKPMLRAGFEEDLKQICLGQKDPKMVLEEQIQKYKEAYRVMISKITAMDEKMALRINETPRQFSGNEEAILNENQIQEVFPCPKCKVSKMGLRKKKTSGFYIGCLNFPDCKNAVWLPDELKEVSLSEENCRRCGTASKMLKIKLNAAYYRSIFNVPDGWYTTCLRCDSKFCETFQINKDQVKQVGAIVGDTNTTSSSSRRVVDSNGTAQSQTNNNTRGGRSLSSNDDNMATASTSSGTSNRNEGKAQSKTKKSSTTKTSKVAAKNNTQQTSIRSFATNSRQTPATEPESQAAAAAAVQDMCDFFGDDDEFDDILGNANLEEAIPRQQPMPSISENEAVELASSLMDDDWGDISWGTSSRQNKTTNSPVPKRSRLETQEPYSWGSRSSQVNNRELNVAPQLPKNNTSSGSSFQWGSTSSQRSNNTSPPRSSSHSKENNQPSSVLPSTSQSGVRCTGCHSLAKELIVKKDGPNKGRPFYGCPKQNACKFFQWADENVNTDEPRTTMHSQPGQREKLNATTPPPLSKEKVKCNCQKSASKLIVRKDGPNQGRWFYACPDRSKSCGFFKWTEDESEMEETEGSWGSNPLTSTAASSWGTNSASNDAAFSWGSNPSTSAAASSKTNRPSTSGRGNTTSNSNNEMKKRKCGICRQEGHTRSKCPRKDEFQL